jgi:predicted DNA-binding protein (MmcQ/YjbR family)
MKTAALRRLVSAWPGVGEDVKWGNDLVFSVGGKMFCAMDAESGQGLSFKVEQSRFLELTARPGIIPAPYLARAQWISLADPGALSKDETQAPWFAAAINWCAANSARSCSASSRTDGHRARKEGFARLHRFPAQSWIPWPVTATPPARSCSR